MSDGAAPTFDIRIVNALGETTTVSCLDRDEVSKLPDCVHGVAWTWNLISLSAIAIACGLGGGGLMVGERHDEVRPSLERRVGTLERERTLDRGRQPAAG